MSLAALASSAQTLAESLMEDACTITRASTDPAVSTPVTVYEGKCRVRVRVRGAGRPYPGDAGTATERDRIEVHIPVSAVEPEFNDAVTITASINPNVTGEMLQVTGRFIQSGASAQRLECERRSR